MSNPPMRIALSFKFRRDIKRLRKKYSNIRTDLESLQSTLERGDTPGDKIQGLGYDAYKVRMRNTDAAKGKRGGYRVIYYVRLSDFIVLVTIYSKSEQTDISVDQLKHIISDYEQESEEE